MYPRRPNQNPLRQNPLPGPYPRVHALPARHQPPRNPAVRRNRFEPSQFFRQRVPFDEQTIRRFAELEGSWLCSHIDPLDRGALRLYIWIEELTTPPVHWIEVAKRWDGLELTAAARKVFLEMARAQNEPRVTNNTARCPLCQSNLLGFCTSDHTYQDCPFNYLRGIDRLHFQALNFISLCRDCNARSANHYTIHCTRKPCNECGKFGHQTHQDLCNHPLGVDSEEAAAAQRTEVHQYRVRNLERMQQMLTDPSHPLNYRCYNDTRFSEIISASTKRIEKYGEGKGWGVVMDPDFQFPYRNPSHYANHYEGLPVLFTGMIPPEFDPDQALPIPEFDDRFTEYLTQVCRTIDHLKATEEYIPPTGPDGFLEYLEELEERDRQPDEPRQPLIDMHQEQPAPAVQEQIQFAQEPVAPEIQEQAPPRQQSTPHASTSSEAEIVGGPNWSQKPLNWTEEMNKDQPSVATKEHSVTSSTQDSLQGKAKTETSKVDSKQKEKQQPQEKTQKDPPLPSTLNQAYERDPHIEENLKKLKKREEEVIQRARMYCREPLIVKGKAIRQQFQTKAFKLLEEEPLPESLRQLEWRARAFQVVICGQDDSRMDIFDATDSATITEYIEMLKKLGRALSPLHYLLVTLEQQDSEKIITRAAAGGDFIFVPSFDLFQLEPVKEALNQLSEIRPNEPSPLEWVTERDRDMWTYKLPETEQTSQFANEKQEMSAEGNTQVILQNVKDNVYDEVSGVFLHNRFALREIRNLKIPYYNTPKKQRIIGLSTFLTGEECKDSATLDNATLDNYIEFLLNVCHQVLELRAIYRWTRVEFSGCPDHIESSATRFHSLVVPKLLEFSNQPYQKWKGYLDSVWKAFRDQNKDATCTKIQGI